GDGHNLDSARRRVEQLIAFIEVRIADAPFGLRALEFGVDVGAFDVQSENFRGKRIVLFRGDGAFDRAHQLFMARSDGRGQISNRSVFQQGGGDSSNSRGAIGHQVVAAAAMEVCINEAWHYDAPRGVDDLRAEFGLDRVHRADSFDSPVFAKHDAVLDNIFRCNDPSASDCQTI